jgi:PAS domain S-box-containing protein
MLTPYSSPDILATIIDSMPDFVFWKDSAGFFRGCNRAFAEICFGCTQAELIGKSDADFIHDPETAAALRSEDLAVMASGATCRLDIWFTVADGSRHCLDTQKIPLLKPGGEVYGLLVVARDITDTKHLGEALLKSEAHYRTLFSNMSEAFALHEIICDQRGMPSDYRFLEINSAFEQQTGLMRDAVIGRRLLEIIPDEDHYWIEIYGRVALTGTTERFTRYSAAINRHYSVYAFSPAPGQFATLFTDATDRIVSEQSLRASETRLKEAQRLARLGYWELVHATEKLQWSDEIYRIFEIDPTQFGASYEAFISYIHPDDRKAVRDAFHQSLSSHSHYSISHRLLMPDGRIKYVHEECETTFDTAGLPVRSTGTVQDITDRKVLQEELDKIVQVEQEQHSFQTIVTNNPAMKTVLELAARVSTARQTTVALYGESGVGKEVLAHAIHTSSSVLPGKFIAINCAAIPENLLESELFGHVRGAFTGAESEREGKLSAASGGTIMLDEIGDMPLALQAKLLRVLEERTFEKVGGNTSQQLECRVIVATNRNLAQSVLEGTFREDLYHRINVFPLSVPPLRERKEDIALLCDHIINKLRQQLGRPLAAISPQVMALLQNYNWPGNIRELRNCLERAAILSNDGVILPEYLTMGIATPLNTIAADSSNSRITFNLSLPVENLSLDALTDQIMELALSRCNGNKAQAAKLLKVGRSAYYRRNTPPTP